MAKETFRGLRSKHPKKIFKESLKELIKDTFDAFLVSESKIDSTFSNSQFSIPGYCIVWKNRNKNGGGILF